MKICKDCEYYSPEFGVSGVCSAPQAYNVVSYVTGKKSRDCKFCKVLRDYNRSDSCGNDAAWFKPRKKRWYRFWR